MVKKKEVKEEVKQATEEQKEEIIQKFLPDELPRYFKNLKSILKKWVDMPEEEIDIVTLWIIGTYFHKQFSSYPYLYFNATKGSGKTRIMNIIANLSKSGKLQGSMTEAVLFRTASENTMCIDEAENINAKGREGTKLLLNSAYKRGMMVQRMTKKKNKEGDESQEVEEFPMYCPISIANIWGLDNTLEDRCITLILEKSSNPKITRLQEDFKYDKDFVQFRGGLKRITDQDYWFENGSEDLFGDVKEEWNKFVRGEGLKGKKEKKYSELFKKIDTGIEGRNLELFFPMFIIANLCGTNVLDDLIEFSKDKVKERREQDREENPDVKILAYIEQCGFMDYVGTSKLLEGYRLFHQIPDSDKWINSRWFGRGLRRLKLVKKTDRQRIIKVLLDVSKAKKLMEGYSDNEIIKDGELEGVFE